MDTIEDILDYLAEIPDVEDVIGNSPDSVLITTDGGNRYIVRVTPI